MKKSRKQMLNKLIKTLFLVGLIFISSLNAQNNKAIEIGQYHTIKSEILKSDRAIQIYLPKSYDHSDIEYPVLYILDGQWHFTNGVAIQESLRDSGLLPEMIIVGIQTTNPLRRTLMSDGQDKFLDFIEMEVITYIDDTLRTSNDRILFGWEAAAFFSNYALLNKKQLFNAAIISNGAYASEKTLSEFNKLSMSEKKYLFIANSEKDIYYIKSSNNFVKLLKQKSLDNLNWKYQKFNDEVHESLAYIALYQGLRFYYDNYGSLVFSNINEFKELGGIPYIEKYFKTRGKRFGFDPNIDNSTKDALIWLAWNHDDFEAFDFFMKSFKEVLSTKRYDSAYWQNRFAQFYLKHESLNNAINYFNHGINKYPQAKEQAQMYSGIAKAYFMKNEVNKAITHIKKAIIITDDLSDSGLKHYQSQLLKYQKLE